MGKIKLFCLPYAGGAAYIYDEWKKYIHPNIQIIPIEYAGRGKRFGEPYYASVEAAVDDIYRYIKNELKDTSYSLFGHSMGSLLAYELGHKIDRMNFNSPMHIFFSGSTAPNINNDKKVLHTLEDDEFKEELFKLGGTPKEILRDTEVMKVFLPILRADIKMNEQYSYIEPISKFDCDFTVFYGNEDTGIREEIRGWKDHTRGECNFYNFPGGHFFIHDHSREIINIINNTLLSNVMMPGSKAPRKAP